MPKLLSGSTLRSGGSNTYINLKGAQPQLPPTDTTSTGYTVVTDSLLQTTYRSSLGNIQFDHGTMFSNLSDQNIQIIGTGTGTVIVSGNIANTSTNTGVLVVNGGVGIANSLWTGEDIHVNGLTIGQGWQGLNNIVIQGTASPQINETHNGQESIVIGYDALTGIETSYKNIAIGRYALSSGTDLSNSIAIGDSALSQIGFYHSFLAATITGVILSTSTAVVAPGNNLITGTQVTITGIVGTTELNNNVYYVKPLTGNNLGLYHDINTNVPLDGSSFTPYASGGEISVSAVYDSNIAVGNGAGSSLINGRQNFFLGDHLAVNLTTGSYNLLIGHEVANNMISGNANIAIGGDQLVDGLDNQISIGSAYYYNGDGYTQLNSDVGIGLETAVTATYYLTNVINVNRTNPVVIYTSDVFEIGTGTEIVITGIVGTTELNDQIYYASYNTATSFSLYYDQNLLQPVNGTGFSAYVSGGSVNSLEPSGALTVLGGVGITGGMMITGEVDVYSGMRVKAIITGTITTSTNLAGGNVGGIPYQQATGITKFIPIGLANTVLVSNGTTATWTNLNNISSSTSTNAVSIFINDVLPDTTYYLGLTESIGDYSPLDSDLALTYVTTTQTTGTYFVTGTNVLNVPGSIYSNDGNTFEQNLVYSPRVTVSANGIPPANPRVGDFWIDPTIAAEMQYIQDGNDRFWLQITQIA